MNRKTTDSLTWFGVDWFCHWTAAVGAGILLALVLLAGSGCTGWRERLAGASALFRSPAPPAKSKPERTGADFTETIQPQNTTDLYMLFGRRKLARMDAAAPGGMPSHRLFAVLVNGGLEGYHQTNILLAANALQQLGADVRNIFILSTGIPWRDNLTYDPSVTPYLVAAWPNVTNFKIVMDYLGGVVTSNDVVLLYLTGHGDNELRYRRPDNLQLHPDHDVQPPVKPVDEIQLQMKEVHLPGGQPRIKTESFRFPSEMTPTNPTMLALQGTSLTALDFQHQLEHLQRAGQPLIVLICDECFGGGFARTVRDTAPRHIAMATTDENHMTSCRTFAPVFWNLLSGRNPDTRACPTLKATFDEAIAQHQLHSLWFFGVSEYFCSAGLDDFSLAAFIRPDP